MKPSPVRVASRHMSFRLPDALKKAKKGLNGEAIQILRSVPYSQLDRRAQDLRLNAIARLDDASYGEVNQRVAVRAVEQLLDHLGVR